ncbi:phage head-tail connector protein [Bacillus sp. FJAT-49736]|uniref:phage head-tail connector protein n=1 Tax=Bacillus sp. FJAT-49736 TaxID=2833582 RepID=UPI001BCA33A5|nr:phage head-tail connector protein [Bacillus sp. FJAT-49736]MBS4172118.1 phage head-tail connector protein [Bacillus sp. FJAT-49736]
MLNKVLEIVKRRLKIIDTSLDDLINDYIEQIEWKIRLYCNISEVPEALKFVWASMTIDILRIEHPNEEAIANTVAESVNSVKLGDTSIAYGNKGTDITNTSKASLDDIVLNYSHELNRFRRLRCI